MMKTADLLDLVRRGEDSQHQFKADITNAKSLAAELVAFANAAGGRLFIGVNDAGELQPLSQTDVQRINQLISNASSQQVHPPINPRTENVSVQNGIVIVVTVPEGISKPYMDNDGIIWIKSGADKRRITAREEMQRMFQQAHLVHADELAVPGTSVAHINTERFQAYCQAIGDLADLSHHQALQNLNLMTADGALNVAGMLLFGDHPQRFLPTTMIKAIAFPGNDVTGTTYTDSKDITGHLKKIYEETMSFCKNNIHWVQGNQSVNSQGQPEIPLIVFEELIVNALLHRDYFISAAIRLMIFNDRIEIISPGHLPNSLRVEHIRSGTSNMRNPTLASHGTRLLPYRGLGSGIRRSLHVWPHIEFEDDRQTNQFRVIIRRPKTET